MLFFTVSEFLVSVFTDNDSFESELLLTILFVLTAEFLIVFDESLESTNLERLF